MAETQRLDDLRRRVLLDPSSIAFAQLAEEYRRAGQHQEAVDVCRTGLTIHPTYLSARVTLGRALLDLQHFDDAEHEFAQVLHSAPENLAAIRGLAEIHHRRGSLAEALTHYRAALALARNDPDLEQTVADLEHQLAPKTPEPDDELSYGEVNVAAFAEASAEVAVSADGALPARYLRATRTIAALEQFLEAIAVSNVTRAERHA